MFWLMHKNIAVHNTAIANVEEKKTAIGYHITNYKYNQIHFLFSVFNFGCSGVSHLSSKKNILKK